MASISNTFDKGMLSDSLPYLQPQGTYRHAINMTTGDRYHKGYGKAFEESNELQVQYSNPIVGAYYVESVDSTVVFTQDGAIHMFDHNTKKSTFVAKDSEFGCDWNFKECEWINATFKTDEPCSELKVYWSSGCEYYVLNITEMLNREKKSKLMGLISSGDDACGYTCDYFRVMKCVCAPNITTIASEHGGNGIENGVYQFVVKLSDNEGNDTNWFAVSNPTSVGSENNLGGERSQWSIDVHLSHLDCRFDKVEIAVISTVKGVTTAEIVAERNYSSDGLTFTYNGQEGRSISLQEIKVKRKTFIRGKDLVQYDNRLWLYGIRQDVNLNMQRQVLSQAKLKFIEIEVGAAMVERHNMRSYERGENYLFGIVYNYCDGTHSPAFLMAPGGGGGSSLASDNLAGLAIINDSSSGSSNSSSGGGSSSSTVTEPSGTGFETKRPRGEATCCGEDGGLYGCHSGGCGGSCGSNGWSGDASRGGENPSEFRGNKSQTQESIETWSTDLQDVEDSAKCDDCTEDPCCFLFGQDSEGNVVLIGPGTDIGGITSIIPNPFINNDSENCVGCSENEEAIAEDWGDLEEIFTTQQDEHTNENQDNTTSVDSSNIKESAVNLMESVDNSEYRVIKKPKFKIDTTASGSAGAERDGQESTYEESIIGSPLKNPSSQAFASTSTISEWSDDYTNSKGVHLIDEKPKVVGSFEPRVVTTDNKYPDTIDCDGEFLYGGKANSNLELFGAPWGEDSPIVKPGSTGVPSEHSPSVDPIYDNTVRLLGIEVSGVPEPPKEQLSKPLCPNNPYSVVMVARDHNNSTIQAKGVMSGTFTGESSNEEVIIPRHGTNSPIDVDFAISSGADGDSRKGNDDNYPGYTFYGLDTAIGQVGLSGSKLRTETIYRGQGYRYGLYAKGKDPDDTISGMRVDQRGARQYININTPSPFSNEFNLKAVGYLKANSVARVDGESMKISNRYRESSVYLGLSSELEPVTDRSFYTDTMNHQAPIRESHMWYGAVVRENKDQYGSVTGMSFIPTGVEGRKFGSTIKGISGDTFIGPYSFTKSGYVSDKVGETFTTPERDRTVCDSPNDKLLQDLGIDWYPTQLPIDGDRSDAKNWCGGYQDSLWNQVSGSPKFDFYYPKTVTTLITTWIESRINPWRRATGENGEVYYPRLKDQHLDSNWLTEHPWEKSYLNNGIHYEVQQPSIAQQTKKALIKNLVENLLPAGFAAYIAGTSDGVLDTTALTYVTPMITAYWYMYKKLITREDYLDKMLGFPICKTDSAGGETDNNITGFRDNHHEYNYDHSKLNYEQSYQAMPITYNTCICNDCDDDITSNEIYYSNKQVVGNQIDSYKNFKAFNYLNMGVDNGRLTKMYNFNGDLYAHTTDFLSKVAYKEISVQTNIGTSLLGGNEVLTRPQYILEGVSEGFAGLQDPNSLIITQRGVFWVDQQARRVYQYSGQLPEAISYRGNEKLFKNYLGFCKKSGCHDEKTTSGTHYSLGYDPMFDRVILSKKDLDGSFTISYDLSVEVPNWNSLHTWIPESFIWDRKDLYTIKDGGIWLHHIKDSYGKFYGESHIREIEFIAVADGDWFTYIDTSLNTEAEIGNLRGLDITFNKVAAYNTTQSTGTRTLEVIGDNTRGDINRNTADDDTVNANKVKRIFRFNNLKDHTEQQSCSEKVITEVQECYPIKKVVDQKCLADQTSEFRGKPLKDDHLVYRLTYDQDNKTQVRLIGCKTEITRDER